ncbi:MAG: bifunctional UDP-N-acetylglucosamine diphosphorylase/glucosamine-1-phosphate N-acetyltransferase GlmU [Bryobacteraceae bacterium]
MSSTPVSVVILAAGLGTRMRSRLAKVLHRAGGACLIEHVIDAALEIAPAERIVAVTGHQADRVRAEVEHSGVRFAVQTEQLGTGHALGVCGGLEGLGAGRIVVLYGDCPLLRPETLRRLLQRHEESGCAATLITTLLGDPTGYGRIIRSKDGPEGAGQVLEIVEEKAATAEQKQIREINSGLYCFEAAPLWQHLSGLQPNPASGEIYLTDIVAALRASGHATAACLVDDPAEILGINTRVELAEADRILRQRKNRELMLAGVTIERPETVTIDKHVTIGNDTIVGPFSQLLGKTRIGSDCRIGAGAILRDARLGDEAEVLAYSVIDDSTLEARARVGPFSRMRMNAHVEAGAHAGNFVELKNTRLGADSKAMHLAYLGDSVIGPDVNIGAGAITCNYDGVKKHQTQIGAGAFIGSNATLVAPVEIGVGSYVAAGSVITEAVPEDALALGRSRQVVKEGWARKRREKAGK